MMRCLPHPLSLLCWLDNRHGPHDDTTGPVCRLHDFAYLAYFRLAPHRAGRFWQRVTVAAGK